LPHGGAFAEFLRILEKGGRGDSGAVGVLLAVSLELTAFLFCTRKSQHPLFTKCGHTLANPQFRRRPRPRNPTPISHPKEAISCPKTGPIAGRRMKVRNRSSARSSDWFANPGSTTQGGGTSASEFGKHAISNQPRKEGSFPGVPDQILIAVFAELRLYGF
jgi:hypothetical protein